MEPTRTPRLAPYLAVRDAPGLIAFLEAGLGGKLGFKQEDADGKIQHAEVLLADSVVMIGERPASRPGLPAMIHLYVQDADAAYRRALAAGASSVREPAVGPDGDRRGGVVDRWGNEWWFTTH